MEFLVESKEIFILKKVNKMLSAMNFISF